MKDGYTPPTGEVREIYVWAYTRNHDTYTTGVSHEAREGEVRAAFNRWLNQTLANTWDEALGEVSASYTIPIPDNPYRKDNIK